MVEWGTFGGQLTLQPFLGGPQGSAGLRQGIAGHCILRVFCTVTTGLVLAQEFNLHSLRESHQLQPVTPWDLTLFNLGGITRGTVDTRSTNLACAPKESLSGVEPYGQLAGGNRAGGRGLFPTVLFTIANVWK